MAEQPEGVDLAALLAPIPGESPTGQDPRQDTGPQSTYYRLRDARSEARAAERAADADGGETAVPPQWRSVRELSVTLLTAQAKDLEVAAWLTEALLRSDGLAGLTAGATLMAGLVGAFWDGLYPMPDEDGIRTRVSPVAGLNGEGSDGTLIQPLRKLPLFPRPDGSSIALWQYGQSVELSGIADPARRQQRVEAGVLPFDTLEQEARAAGGARFAALRASAGDAHKAWGSMAVALEGKAGADSPPTSRVRDLLAQLVEIAARFAPPEAAGEPAEATAGVAEAAGGGAQGTPARVPGALGSREEALRTLAVVAEYFHRTEPHSPLAYTLEEAVRRARLSWPDFLAEIVPDTSARAAILTSLGIRPPPTE
jgi:type VI secretion system protein ImpA